MKDNSKYTDWIGMFFIIFLINSMNIIAWFEKIDVRS